MNSIRRSLSAEWLRITRRWDAWGAGALAVCGAVLLYLLAFRTSTSVMGVDNPGSWGSGSGRAPEQWFLDAMLSLRAPYAFPASLTTILDSSWLLAPLGAYAALSTFGPDFWWGTLRTVLVTNPSRVRYLFARLAIIGFLIIACFFLVLAIAPVAELLLVLLTGERFPRASIDLGIFLKLGAARVVEALGYTLFATAFALISRSLVGGCVLLAGFVGLEVSVGGIATSMGAPLIREFTFSGAVNSMVEQLRPQPIQMVVDYSTGTLAPAAQQPAAPVHLLSIESSMAVALSWVALAALVAFLRMRTMDIAD